MTFCSKAKCHYTSSFGASSELAPNMFGASSELASVMEFGFKLVLLSARYNLNCVESVIELQPTYVNQ